MKFQNVHFLKSVANVKELPFFGNLPELAVLGRSNVGKSTLLNHLFHSKNLVKTSSTPGKTRVLNFFNVDQKIICVDMPGFGYAAVSTAQKQQWANLIEGYLNSRQSLKVLLYLFDIRRTPTAEDEQMLNWIMHSQIPPLLVLTKVDKLTFGQRMNQTARITSRFKEMPHVHYSAVKNEGRKELIAKIKEIIDAA